MSFDVGIGPQSNRRAEAFTCCDPIYVREFRLTLDVETVNAMLKRIFDFLAGFPDAGKSAFGWVAARGQDAKKFSARDNIEAGAFSGQQGEDGAVGIRLDRVTDQMIDAGECAFQPPVMIANCAGAVDVERRPEFLGDLLQVGSFTMKATVAVVKGMHWEKM
jgi:hypothetical protein